MTTRFNRGRRPQITFTSDFHELVQGDLDFSSGPCPCVLRYDPLRIVDDADTDHGEHAIRAFIRFHPAGTEWQGRMQLPEGAPLAEMADPGAQGVMLETRFEIPVGTHALEVWFCCAHKDGVTHWDSDQGKNHWLRFALRDITLDHAKVVADASNPALDEFDVQLLTPANVDRVTLRWRTTNVQGSPRQESDLKATSGAKGKSWGADGVKIPKGATVAFDVVYYVADRKFTDDNQGRWYIAD